MTKISELSTTTTVGPNDQLVMVQNGTTYNVNVNTLQNFISGSVGSTGQSQTPIPTQNAVPFLQKESMYGIPRVIELVEAGTGYPADAGNEVLKCVHQALMYPQSSDVENDVNDATPYLARGMEVQITQRSNTGGVEAVRLVQPGQFYRIGDVLAISPITGEMSPTGRQQSLQGVSQLAQVRVVDIEPFMTGTGKGLMHLGSNNPWVQNPIWGGEAMNSLTSWSDQFRNPQNTTLSTEAKWAEGYGIEMAADWSSSLYMSWNCSPTNEFDAFDVYGDTANYHHPFSDAGLYGIGVAARVPGVLSSTAFHVDVCLPGTWFIVGVTLSGNPTYMNSSEKITSASFPSDTARPSGAPADALWPTNRFFWNKHYLAGKIYGGLPLREPMYSYTTDSRVSQGVNLTTPISMTRDDFESQIRSEVEEGVMILNQKRYGIWKAQKTTFNNDNATGRGRTLNPKSNRSVVVPHSGGTNHTCGFYFVNIDEVLPPYTPV